MQQPIPDSTAAKTSIKLVLLSLLYLSSAAPCAVGQNNVGVGVPTSQINSGRPPAAGFSLNGSLAGLGWSVSGAQGSSTSMSSQSPMVTTSNGATGILIDAVWRPFVIGYAPVVGGYHAIYPGMYSSPAQIPPPIYPLRQKIQRLAQGEVPPPSTDDARSDNFAINAPIEEISTARSTATQPDISVAEIRRRQAALEAADEATVAEFVARAQAAKSRGDRQQAIHWIDQARRNSTGKKRKSLEAQIRGLRAADL